MSWASMRDRMLNRAVSILKDGTAQYHDRTGTPVGAPLAVIIDHNLMQAGAEGMFRSDAIGVSWRKPLLQSVERGGYFIHNGVQLVVDEPVVADDGHMVTAACMEMP